MSNDDISPILLPIIQSLNLSITAEDIVGTQPMTGQTGAIFKLKHSYYSDAIHKMDSAIVDEETWYNIHVTREVHNHIITEYDKEKNKTWVNLGTTRSGERYVHDVNEQIYIMLLMKWS